MKLSMKSLIFASLATFSSATMAFENIGDHTKECIYATAIAAKDYPFEELPHVTKQLCQLIATKTKKSLDKITSGDIKKAINMLTSHERTAIYNAFQKEDKQITLEGLFVMFLDETNEDSLKQFVDKVLFLIYTGNPLSVELQTILLNNKDIVKYIREYKTSALALAKCGGLISKYAKEVKEDLLGKYDIILKQVPEELQEEVKSAVAKRKARYIRSSDEESVKKEIEELEKKISEAMVKRLRKN